MTAQLSDVRLTQYAAGGGCACKVPPGELERVLADLPGSTAGGTGVGDLVVGLEHGDDGAAVRIDEGPGGRAVIATADFFTPVVDDAYDWGRIAAANALSDIYAMGGEPLLAINLLAWPRDKIPFELAAEVLRGGADVCLEAGTHLAGGHSIDDPEPKYGLAVTGFGNADTLLRNDAAEAGTALTLTKPLGLGILNNRHKATGQRFDQAIAAMTTLNREASRAAVEAGVRAATDVTGFGLLGHLYKMARASGVTAVVDCRRGALPRRRTRLARAGIRARWQPSQPRLGAAAPRRPRGRGRAGAPGRCADLRWPARRRRAAGSSGHRRARPGRRVSPRRPVTDLQA